MNIFTAVILIVTILGTTLIIAIVWLVYEYKSVKRKIQLGLRSLPPVRRMVIDHGRVVPASRHTTALRPQGSVPSLLAQLRNPVRKNHGSSMHRSPRMSNSIPLADRQPQVSRTPNILSHKELRVDTTAEGIYSRKVHAKRNPSRSYSRPTTSQATSPSILPYPHPLISRSAFDVDDPLLASKLPGPPDEDTITALPRYPPPIHSRFYVDIGDIPQRSRRQDALPDDE